jgi:ABC-type phosphonate transport system ATPase subunit
MRTDWAFVHQNPRDGLRMGVSAGGNVGERLMAVGARHYGEIRAAALDWLGGSRSPPTASTTGREPSRAGCSSGCRSRATW